MLTPYEIIIRLLLSSLLGGIIGFERQAHGRPAGFRTQLLVCVACTLLMLISQYYYMESVQDAGYIRFDPTRIAAGAMTGIGFLGAGVILKTAFAIQGLTTAACIWIVAAIGLAVGAGQFTAGISGFIITVFSLWVLRIIERRIPQLTFKHVTLTTDETSDEHAIISRFTDRGFEVSKMEYEIDFSQNEKVYSFTIANKDITSMRDIVESFANLAFVKKLRIRG